MRHDETIYIHLQPYENEAREAELKRLDNHAIHDIQRLEEVLQIVRDYRKQLYAHTQTLQGMQSKTQLKLTRRKDYNGYVFYYLTIKRVYPENESMYQDIISETYTGTERHNALKRFEALKKEYAGIEAVKNIDKGRWEK